MRLRELRVKSYGHFRDLSLPLDGEGLRMIVGPNEAGKTTLLEFVRELLFGFAERTPYMFGDGRPEGSATLVLDSGSVVELNRRKGRKRTVSLRIDGADSDLGDEGFNGLLGQASANLFRSIFAFGLDELAAGEKSLSDQGVKSALFSGGAAGATNPQKVLEALQNESDKLFREKSRSLVINNLLSEISSLSKQVSDKSVRCDAYEQRRAELEQAEAEAAALGEEWLAASRDFSLKRKLALAFPPWLELGRLRGERAGLTAPEGFPADGRSRFEALEVEINRLDEELARARAATDRNSRELADVRVDPRLIDRRAEIEGLNRTIQAVQDARRDLPLDARMRDESTRKAADRLASLVPGWSLDDLRGFRPTAETRETLEGLMREHGDRTTKQNDLARDRETLLETIRERESDLAGLGDPIDVAPLAALLKDVDEYHNDVGEAKRREAELRKTRRAIDELLPRLNPPLEHPAIEAVDLPAPPREAVARFRRRFEQHDKLIAPIASGIARDEASLGDLERELAALNAGGDSLPTREGLASLRTRRDAGWALIRRRLAEGRIDEVETRAWLVSGPSDLLDAYERAVEDVDRYADEMQRRSSAVAKQEQARLARERLDGDRRRLAEAEADRNRLLEDWRALWVECWLTPLDPETMEGWLDRLDELRTLRGQAAEHEQEGSACRDRASAFEARLRALTSASKTGAEAVAAELLVDAREREKAARADDQSRRDLRQELRRLRDKVDRIALQAAEIQTEHEDWRKRWRAILKELRLPVEWDAGLVDRVVRDLSTTIAELEAADGHAGRVSAHEARLAEFERRVKALVADLAPDLADGLPEQTVATLQSRLTDSVKSQERKTSLEKNLDESKRLEVDHEAKRAAAIAEREALYAAAGVETAEAFRAIAARASRIVELDREIGDRERSLELIREQEPLDAFLARLEGADGDVLKADCEQAEALRDQAQKRKSAADQNVGSRRQALSEFQKGSGDAAAILEKVSAQRAALAGAVDRYVPLVFAQHLLKQTIQRFEQDSQPAMLRETSRIFQTMTAGRFTRVERPSDDESPLLVHRIDDEVLEPQQLSTGTREQLYLAVRLAYVLHYCDRAESLPIVMDDVLANFDDDRARHTLRALGDLSRRVQVVLFTCHPHLAALGREVFPDLRPLTIPTTDAEAPDPRSARGRQRTLQGLSPST